MAPVASSTLTAPARPDEPDSPMHLILPNLWLGDYLAANTPDLLALHGIRYVISALRWKPQVVAGVTYLHVEVDDTPDADLLAHLPACVRFISDALAANQGVLVHCQAGVSRSATIVVAYLMSSQSLPAEEALALVRAARPQASPSETFLAQLGLWREGGFKVSRRDKATRRFYLNRTAEEVMNGDGSPVPLTMMASWPLTPSSSTPSTPQSTSAPKRRIRCHKCRRELATREHMLDHNVGSSTQPSTPGALEGGENLNPWEQRTSLSRPGSRPGSRPESRAGSRRSSSATGEKPALAQLSLGLSMSAAALDSPPSALPRRRSSASSPLAQELPVPTESVAAAPPLSTPTIPEDAVAPSPSPGGAELRPPVRKPSLRRSFGTAPGGEGVRISQLAMTSLPTGSGTGAGAGAGREEHADSAVSEDDDEPLPHLPSVTTTSIASVPSSTANGTGALGLLSGSALNASLPPALAALRSASASASLPSAVQGAGGLPMRKKSFNLHMSRIDGGAKPGAGEETGAQAQGMGVPLPPGLARVADRQQSYFSPPILANPNCSGYFLEPMKWMDFLEQGEMGGAIFCPNKKCGAKLGNYDWAGVRCGCKEWIVPGFCIHKTKVDEDL
ncbi:DSPc-domain-containing protein [Calocera viscosa TUFC12733]|uniref:protein-tyrosine-phosphatase n=1 Tax=Calocera viscosa (strain TUFC12733) TaxID=1330018 RepID=A0A167L798_CALVF|nr:DSPc-domain-containing protein [Calocera viscosa TUFC12733]